MHKIVFAFLIVLAIATFALASNLHFSKNVPGASSGTLGTNQKLELQKAAIDEIKTKMENWASFTGYSTGTNR